VQNRPPTIIFARLRHDDPHWYANIGFATTRTKAYTGNGQPDVSYLWLDLAPVRDSSLRRPRQLDPRSQITMRASPVLLSPVDTDFFHLFEFHLDGAGLRQLTDSLRRL
jgi:hypothetical protein